eukprot:496488-Lingulodinium_polyedra.AAC.1
MPLTVKGPPRDLFENVDKWFPEAFLEQGVRCGQFGEGVPLLVPPLGEARERAGQNQFPRRGRGHV